MKIDQLVIRDLRGIPDATLSLGGKSLFLYGENGTGKSCVVDSLEFFFTGTLKRLTGVQTLSLKRHLAHVGSSSDDVSVSVSFSDRSETVYKRTCDALVPPQVLAAHVEDFGSAARGTFVLRRSQLLQFIDSEPAVRFRALEEIMGVERLDNIELEMRRAKESENADLSGSTSQRQAALGMLTSLLGESIGGENDVLDAFNRTLEKWGIPGVGNLGEAPALLESLQKNARQAQLRTESTKDLLHLRGVGGALDFPSEVLGEAASLAHTIESFLAVQHQGELALGRLLAAADDIISKDPATVSKCPLCEHSVDGTELLENIRRRRGTILALSTTAGEISRRCRDLMRTVQGISDAVTSVESKLGVLGSVEEIAKAASACNQSLDGFVVNLRSCGELQGSLDLSPLECLLENLRTLRGAVEGAVEAKIQAMDLGPQDQLVVDAVTLVSSVVEKLTELRKAEAAMERHKRMLALASLVYDAFSASKKAVVQSVYDDIKQDCSDFYVSLHPDEVDADLELSVLEGRRASAMLTINSFGQQNQDPRAYSSEGHLDSLGLCVFLAFAKEFQPPFRTIVLDDVVTAIDVQHRQRICTLLRERFKDWQVIVTTHDPIWFNELEAEASAYGWGQGVVLREITGWTLAGGPVIESPEDQVTEIRKLLSEGRKGPAGNLARTHLESVLKHACLATGASVRYLGERPRYSAGDLVGALRSRMKEFSAELYHAKLDTALRPVEATQFMTNLLSHDNPEAENLSAQEIKEFSDAVDELESVVRCSLCHRWLSYDAAKRAVTCKTPSCTEGLVAQVFS